MSKFGKALFALSGVAISLLGAASFADETYATYHIRLESNPALSEVLPATVAPEKKDQVSFHLINNTGKAAYFVNGEQKSYIPVISGSTVTVPYEYEKYSVVDDAGKTIFTWNMHGKTEQSSHTSASKAQYSQWNQQIQQVLAASQNRSYNWEPKAAQTVKTERTVTTSSKVTRGVVVRGFW